MATESLIELSWTTGEPRRDRWRARLLAREPLSSVATVALVAAAGLLIASAAVHLHLWSSGYRAIPSIGPLFLVQGTATPLVALILVVTRRLVVVVTAWATMAATVAGFLLADTVGLFGFHDGFAAPYASTAFVIEVAAIMLLVIGAVRIVRGSQHDQTMAQRGIAVDEMLDDVPTLDAGGTAHCWDGGRGHRTQCSHNQNLGSSPSPPLKLEGRSDEVGTQEG